MWKGGQVDNNEYATTELISRGIKQHFDDLVSKHEFDVDSVLNGVASFYYSILEGANLNDVEKINCFTRLVMEFRKPREMFDYLNRSQENAES
jgi:hypothetical protein